MPNDKNSIGPAAPGSLPEIRTGNAVVDDLLAVLVRHPGSLIAANDPHTADAIRGYGVPDELVGVLLSLPAGWIVVLDRDEYARFKAAEDEQLARIRER